MNDALKKILDETFADVEFDTAICTKLIRLDVSFVNKNEEHASFFGQGSIGVERVVFTSGNRDDFFIDTFSIDEDILQKKVTAAAIEHVSTYPERKKKFNLKTKVSFSPSFENSQDVFNIACLYVVYRLGISKTISKEIKYQTQMSVLNYLNYCFLCSLIRKYYPYPPDPEIARATFASLSNMYLIKKLGSWHELVKYRSESVLNQNSIWLDVVDSFNDDDRIAQCINDIKGRMNSHVGEITTLFHQLHRKGTKIGTDASVFTHDGEKILKEIDSGHISYVNYILGVIPDKNGFVKGELVDTICAIIPACSPRVLKEILEWYSGNYASLNFNHFLKGSIEKILEHSFAVLAHDKKMFRKSKDLAYLLVKFKNLYNSSRTNVEDLDKLKNDISKGITMFTSMTSFDRAAATRNGFMLYVIARTFAKSHYDVI